MEKANNDELNSKKKRVSLSDITSEENIKEKSKTKEDVNKTVNSIEESNHLKNRNNEKNDKRDNINEESSSKRAKVKLDELIKKTKEDEKTSVAKDKVIVSEFKKDKEIKENVHKAERDLKNKKKKIEKEIDLIGGAKTEKDIKKEEKLLEKEKKANSKKAKETKETIGEINLDVLGVPRAKEPKYISDKMIKLLGCIFATCIVIITFMFLPFFEVKELNITGLSMLSKEKIHEQIGFSNTKNFFLLYFSNINEKLNEIPEIKKSEVRFIFPNNVDIKISEIRTAGYIPYLTEYVYIDSDGKVVSITNEKFENVPLIEGLNFSSFKLGNVLETSNEESLKTIIEVTNVLNKYDLLNMISSIDVTDFENITLYVDKIEINIGTLEECDHKIRVAIEAVNNLSKGVKGYLNVSDTNGRIYFRPIA